MRHPKEPYRDPSGKGRSVGLRAATVEGIDVLREHPRI